MVNGEDDGMEVGHLLVGLESSCTFVNEMGLFEDDVHF